jgi:hypothetical protein
MSRFADHLEQRQAAYRLAAAALVFAASLLIGYHSYRDTVFTTDENSYLFQAAAFSDLALRRAPPPPPLDQLLMGGMNVIDPERGWFSRYPPGHSLWLLPGLLLGAPRLMSALAAALSLWLLTGAARILRAPGWAAAMFLLLSPYFLFMHGTLLSHTSGLLAASLMLWAHLRWRENRQPRDLALAGAAWAFLFLGRPYTAALLVPAFALDALLVWHRRRDRQTFGALVAFALAALLGPVLALLYNFAVTGDAMQTPYLLYEPGPALGFHGRHTPAIGWHNLQANVALLDTWLLGTPGTLAALVLFALAGASSFLAWFAVLAVVSVMGGYIFFYHHGVNSCGPYYYFETLPFLVLIWVLFVRRMLRLKHRAVAVIVLGLLVAFAACSSLPFSWQQSAKFRKRSSREVFLSALIRAAPPGAVIAMVNEHYNRGDDLRTRLRPNLRGLDSDPLVIDSLEDDDFITASFFPNRPFLRLRNTKTPCLEPLPIARVPYAVKIPSLHTRNATGRGNGSEDVATWCRLASAGDAPGLLAFGRSCIAPAGGLKAVFDLTVSNVPRENPVILSLVNVAGGALLASQAVSGTRGRIQQEVPFQLPAPASVEPRVFYGGAGEVSFGSVTIEEAEAPATTKQGAPP